MKNYLASIVSSPKQLGILSLVFAFTLLSFSLLIQGANPSSQDQVGIYNNHLLLAGPANTQSKVVNTPDKACHELIKSATKAAKGSIRSKISEYLNKVVSDFHDGFVDGYEGK